MSDSLIPGISESENLRFSDSQNLSFSGSQNVGISDSRPAVQLVPALAREHARGLHPRVRRGAALGFQSRWWSILGVALQKGVASAVLRDSGEDLPTTALEPAPALGDLPVLP